MTSHRSNHQPKLVEPSVSCARERERERESRERERESERESRARERESATYTERACGGSSASNKQSTNKNKQESRLGSIWWSVLEMADPPVRLLNFVSENEVTLLIKTFFVLQEGGREEERKTMG